ncbi:hypothetical protein ACJ73_09130 [Blastomyces percursus]|uniref:Uncharacterized protein n=1 Tax=Blastomyces percursus TaxID=1658174 RepID=A0A1J9PDB3_9EURO|nr:hypothetical protein ACJ73_09130 [Blastomyces percursus]
MAQVFTALDDRRMAMPHGKQPRKSPVDRFSGAGSRSTAEMPFARQGGLFDVRSPSPAERSSSKQESYAWAGRVTGSKVHRPSPLGGQEATLSISSRPKESEGAFIRKAAEKKQQRAAAAVSRDEKILDRNSGPPKKDEDKGDRKPLKTVPCLTTHRDRRYSC